MAGDEDDGLDVLLALAEEADIFGDENEEPHVPRPCCEETNVNVREKHRPALAPLQYLQRSDCTGPRGTAKSLLAGNAEAQEAPKRNVGAEETEKMSGLTLVNIEYSLAVLCERLAEVWFVKLSQIKEKLGSKTPEMCWATVGVLVEKSKPLASSNGEAYSRWKLSDLQGESYTLFLFGEAHRECYRESIGSTFAIFDAKLRPGKGQPSLSLGDSSQLTKLGKSRDLASCAAKQKDGRRCSEPVNKLVCPYCPYHIEAGLKQATKRGRAQLKGANLDSAFRSAQRAYGLARGVKPGGLTKMIGSAAAAVASRTSAWLTPSSATAQAVKQNGPRATATKPTGPPVTAPQKSKAQVGGFGAKLRLEPGSNGPPAARHPLGPKSDKTGSSKRPNTVVAPSDVIENRQVESQQTASSGEEMVTLDADESTLMDIDDPSIFAGLFERRSVGVQAAKPTAEDRAKLEAAKPGIENVLPEAGTERGQPRTAMSPKRGLKRVEQGSQGGKTNPKRRALATSHRPCVYDGEVGGMVEEGHADGDWLNGRAAMPHAATAKAAGCLRPESASAQAVFQKPPNHVLRRCEAAEQATRDAEARSRAADVMKGRNLAEGSAPSATNGTSAVGEQRAKQGSHTKPNMAPSSKPANGFYSKGAAAEARMSSGTYSRALQHAKDTQKPTGFAAAFGSILEGAPSENAGSRYAGLVDGEEDERLDKVMTNLQTRDECQARAEAVTKLAVSAYKCDTCERLSEHRLPSCAGHSVSRVRVTKRWWLCGGCGDHSSTLGVRLPQTRCRRCSGMDFRASSMRRAAKERLGPDARIASSNQMVTTVEEAVRRSSAI